MRLTRLTLVLIGVSLLSAVFLCAQHPPSWQLQDSGSAASLRGVHSLNGAVAWASGSGGTVLRTVDGGAHWEKCAVPDGDGDGATLDLRGIQGFGANTAIVMASGPGDKSRLYKTTNGCKSWRLLFKNPNSPAGFFDSFWFNGSHGILLSDPVGGQFVVYLSANGGKSWKHDRHPGLDLAGRPLAAFAASNSCIAKGNQLFTRTFAAGGKDGSLFFNRPFYPNEELNGLLDHLGRKSPPWKTSPIPLAHGADSSGAYSIAYRYPVTTGICKACSFDENSRFIAVGGDFNKPNETSGTAAWSADGGEHWTAAATPPHGYRSSVEWSEQLHAWITVGPNGSDISRDDGKTWQPLDDGNWNALSLPFLVGPNGRIARLNPTAVANSAPTGQNPHPSR
jgi:hypothetical protein